MIKEKKIGIWMDNYHAGIVGQENPNDEAFKVLAYVTGEQNTQTASEKHGNNHEKMLQAKFFKEISTHLTNATHLHVTGPGLAQEKFIHFLESVPQFKKTKTSLCTSNKMSEDQLLKYMEEKLK